MFTGSAFQATPISPPLDPDKPNNQREISSTPPVGYVKFCSTGAAECKARGTSEPVAWGSDKWKELLRVNSAINHQVESVSDLVLYGEKERWAYPIDKGDGEDIVLLKKRTLMELGFSVADLLITIVRDENDKGHAVLSVTTNLGDFILDNRRNTVRIWSATDYKFIKRQSHTDPLHWISLDNKPSHGHDLSTLPRT